MDKSKALNKNNQKKKEKKMNNRVNFFVYLTIITIILLNMGVNADVPHLISYQGRILDSRTGEPVPDG
ncbi:hypothetical protein JXI42_12505, partial [bacterium]|nr:hypothetical protein [bacterium]